MIVSQEFNLTSQTRKFSRKELYELRDKSGLSRREFYLRMVENIELKEKVDIGGHIL